MKHYDMIIIGSGAANIVSDAAIDAGLKIAICERGKFGGTCLTRGCIPTKVLATVANKINDLKHLAKIGINIDLESLEINQTLIKERVFNKIDESLEIADEYRDCGVDVYEGEARFRSNKELVVKPNDAGDEILITADKILIATGARTKKLDIKGLDEVGYMSSESFFSQEYPLPFPKSITILGGGYIACEFASIFNAFGSEVNLIQRSDRILSSADKDISLSLMKSFESRGINVCTSTELLEVKRNGDSKEVVFKYEGLEKSLLAEEIFLAMGVESNADSLYLEKTDILCDERNYIVTNEGLETSVSGVYCLGDANGRVQLRHKANKEAEILCHNLFSTKEYKRMDYSLIPSAVFTYPEIASVGMTYENACKEFGVENIVTTKMYYKDIAKGYALGYENEARNENNGDEFIKIVVEKNSHKILGVHIIGEEAAVLLHPYSYMMNLAQHEIAELNTVKASAELKEARKNMLSKEYILDKTDTVDELVTAHPSLAELATWVVSNLEYEK